MKAQSLQISTLSFRITACVLWVFLAATSPMLADEKISPSVELSVGGRPLKVWVTFTDKGVKDVSALQDALDRYWAQAPERVKLRRKFRAQSSYPDLTDLPIEPRYVDAVAQIGARLRGKSRWLNSISVEATPEQIRRIAELPFVHSIDAVMVYVDTFYPPPPDSDSPSSKAPAAPRRLNYGLATTQVTQIQADFLHEQGFTGKGVVIGVLDSGFKVEHIAFQEVDVLAQRDFVHDDDNTADEEGQDDADQDDHGSIVLGILAGNTPERLIGVAYRAGYLLGKTEKVSENGRTFEQEIEEDWWIEGIEWLEEMGADLVSTSLGYSKWYSFKDLDGKTSKVTIAADLAVQKGMPVIVAAGNLGGFPPDEDLGLTGRINTPADGFGVFVVGAVASNGKAASFSSRGPTFDGRIKPDVMALGIDVASINPTTVDRFHSRLMGTSVAAPLAAGVVALLMQAFPLATPADLADALRSTATRADQPDNLFGYGIIQARLAYAVLLDQFGQTGYPDPIAVDPEPNHRPVAWGRLKQAELAQNYPNPFNAETWIPFKLTFPGRVAIRIYDLRGQVVNALELGNLPAGDYTAKHRAAYWNGRNLNGERAASGSYFYTLEFVGQTYTRKMIILE
jgi:subtilisin family serine protease